MHRPERRAAKRLGRREGTFFQHERFNRTALATTVVVAVTSKMKYGSFPENLVYERAGRPPRPWVVNVTQPATVDRSLLGPRLGSLSASRLAAVWAASAMRARDAEEKAPDAAG